MLKNTPNRYGQISVAVHWLSAVLVVGLYFLGLYMTGLSYYDTWYHQGPVIHKSVGILFAGLLVFRLAWRAFQVQPEPINPQEVLANRLAHWVHLGLYGLLLLMVISGYLISTAKGHPIPVFSWFELPALLAADAARGELAGEIHYWAGHGLAALVLGHAGAALMHHYWHKDDTLKRMLRWR